MGSADLSFQLEASTNAALNFVDARDVTPFVQLVRLGVNQLEGLALESKVATRHEDAAPEAQQLDLMTPEQVASSSELRKLLTLVPAADLDDDIDDDPDGG